MVHTYRKNQEWLLLTVVIESILCLCKSNLMFVPCFSLFNIFIQIPDSYDKCEPGLNRKIHLQCKNWTLHANDLVCTRGRSLLYNLIRICPTALHGTVHFTVHWYGVQQCMNRPCYAYVRLKQCQNVLAQRAYSASTIPYVRSYNVSHPAEQYLNTLTSRTYALKILNIHSYA